MNDTNCYNAIVVQELALIAHKYCTVKVPILGGSFEMDRRANPGGDSPHV